MGLESPPVPEPAANRAIILPKTGWRNYRPGPAMLVTAAFIGPGTVTTCVVAGMDFGFALLWALLFATVATIFLQNMAARVAITTDKGLAEAILDAAPRRGAKWLIGGLIFAALAIGNATYEAGNLIGAGIGLSLIGLTAEPGEGRGAVWFLGPLAMLLVILGKPKWLEYLLIALVMAMTIAFVGALLVTPLDLWAITGGLIPRVPEKGLVMAVALIGTTIVPYNLFLHAATARRHFGNHTEGFQAARRDTIVAVSLGGLLSMAILILAASAAQATTMEISPLVQTAQNLQASFGVGAKWVFAAGLAGAGFSSALTAPLATGYVLSEMLGWKDDAARRTIVFKATAVIIIAIGTIFALLALDATELILIAQTANGLLLPVIAGFLLWVACKRTRMTRGAMLAGCGVVLLCTGLGLRLILRALGLWP